MEIIQFAFHGHEPAEIGELVYDSLLDTLIPACRLPWVESIFHQGHPAFDAFEEMYAIKEKLNERLGSTDDRDLCEMSSCIEAYARAIGLEMFKYGQKFQQMLEEEQKQGTP